VSNFNSPSRISTSCGIDRIESALCHLLHTIERYLTHPDLGREGLSLVLDAAEPRITTALRDLGRQTDADQIAGALKAVHTLAYTDVCSGGQDGWRETLSTLLSTIDGLLFATCLPLNDVATKSPSGGKGMSRDEAQPKVRAYLKSNPSATREEVAKAVGCATGTVSYTDAWKRTAPRRKRAKAKLKKVGLDYALNEEAITHQHDPSLEELIEQQSRDDDSDYPLIT
jgi:hypothetical protein